MGPRPCGFSQPGSEQSASLIRPRSVLRPRDGNAAQPDPLNQRGTARTTSRVMRQIFVVQQRIAAGLDYILDPESDSKRTIDD